MDKQSIYQAWRNAGFLAQEAQELTYGSKGINIDARAIFLSKSGRLARLHRGRWIRDLRARGWTDEEIERELHAYYMRDTKRSPWDFIRVEYRPPRRKDFRDYREAARTRAEAETKTLYR
jgi:hypothetical protein